MTIPDAPTRRPAAGQSTRSASRRTLVVIAEPQLSDVASLDEAVKGAVAVKLPAARNVATPTQRSRRLRPVVVSIDVVPAVIGQSLRGLLRRSWTQARTRSGLPAGRWRNPSPLRGHRPLFPSSECLDVRSPRQVQELNW